MLAEDYVFVLDYLPRGKSSGFKSEPIAQVVGTVHFTLLEVVPKENAELKIGEKIYVGKENRDRVDHIKRRISYSELTNTALGELEKAVDRIVRDDEEKFLAFYNTSAPITIKRHQLELLPGLGKKHMLNILKEREQKPFSSYKEIEERIHLMPDSARLIARRILDELSGKDVKHYVFTRPPAKKYEFGGR